MLMSSLRPSLARLAKLAKAETRLIGLYAGAVVTAAANFAQVGTTPPPESNPEILRPNNVRPWSGTD